MSKLPHLTSKKVLKILLRVGFYIQTERVKTKISFLFFRASAENTPQTFGLIPPNVWGVYSSPNWQSCKFAT